MSNNSTVIRRKWAFEKGRNSHGAIFAAIITAAVTLAAFYTLDYQVSTPGSRRQTTDFAFISQDDYHTLQLIGEFDPANTYRINSGGYPFCLKCRRSHDSFCEYTDNFIKPAKSFARPEVPLYDGKTAEKVPVVPDKEYHFPASGNFAPVIPDEPAAVKELTVTDQYGRKVEKVSGKLRRINRTMKGAGITAVRISGSGLLANITIVSSCGSRMHDLEAGNILKSSHLAPGVYTIYWNGGEKDI